MTNLRKRTQEWRIPCEHADYLSKGMFHDFSVLALGAAEAAPSGSVARRWRGGYKGRPGLLRDLMPALSRVTRLSTPNQAAARRNALASFFRFLDAFEKHSSVNGAKQEVSRLHHITALHMKHYSMPGPDGKWSAAVDTQARAVRAVIKAAVEDLNLPFIFMGAIQDPRIHKETPSEEAGLKIIRFLRGKVQGIVARWRQADRYAQEGRNLLHVKRDPHPGRGRPSIAFETNVADAHATYRALIVETGKANPTTTDLAQVTGMKIDGDLPCWWPRYGIEHPMAGKVVKWREVAAGVYPTAEDVALFHLLFVARSAWNAVTAASINLASWNSQYDAENRWIFAPKTRSDGDLQWTISPTVGNTSSYSLVSSLEARGAPLRAAAGLDHDLANLPDVAVRSPWVGITVSGYNPIYVVDPYNTATINNRLRAAIIECNAQDPAASPVPEMTVGDFRDLAASIIYKRSKYSSWVVHLLLGHKHVRTSRAYGFRQASHAESFGQVSEVLEDLLGQIEIKKKFDISLTRAKLSGLKVSSRDIERLEEARKHRTYDGSGCADPFHPPVGIDPGNAQDGCTICVQQHRCAAAGCPNAFVFEDSLSHLCKRVAELEQIKATVGMVRFDEGSEGRDLEVLRKTLSQWPQMDVEHEKKRWADKIAEGSHKPVQFSGQH